MNRPTMCIRWASWAVALATLIPREGTAQLTSASAAPLGTANNYTALARGFGAIALNPAGLGMPGTPSFSLAVIPVRASATLDPIGLSELADYDDTFLPASVKEQWLNQIGAAQGLSGGADADVTGFALNVGSFGLQVSSTARVAATLNEDAAELVLFGNAGRTGSPRDFELANSSLDGFAASTVAVSFALPTMADVGQPGAAFSVGATLKYTMGHVLLLARDAGSLVGSDPLLVDLQFPMIGPPEGLDSENLNSGTGIGLDLGTAWVGGPLALGASIQNVFNTFEWDLTDLIYRPAEAFFDQTIATSDFDSRPASQAPQALRAEVAELGFEPILNVGAALSVTPTLTVSGDVRYELGEGLAVGPRRHVGVGGEFTPAPFLILSTGVALVSEATRIAAGLGLSLGPVHLTGAAMAQRGDRGDTTIGMFTLSFGGR